MGTSSTCALRWTWQGRLLRHLCMHQPEASARNPEEEQRRLGKIDQYISRMLTDRNSKRTMAEFTSIPPAFWRDHPDRRPGRFTLGPG